MNHRRGQLRPSPIWWLLLPYLVLAVGAGFMHTCSADRDESQLSGHAKMCAACDWSRTQAAETTGHPVCLFSETIEQAPAGTVSFYHHEPCIRLASRAPPSI